MPKSEMLVNYVPGEECRIAVVHGGKLEEFYQERASAESHVGNIYKGRVTNVEPSIQAAFIDFGLERNGFLHISDLHPKYFPGKDREEFEKVGSKTPRRDRPPIQQCLRRGQDVLVQVLKEGIGTKGPTLTSYLSIPGRFLVMMPDMQRMGVSRKVDDDDARREMRDILKQLDPPSDFGFIVRTAGIGQTKTDLKRDLAYLQRLWKTIDRRMKQTRRVGELYTESDLIIRTIRDVFTNDIERVVIDDLQAARRAADFMAVANPRTKSKVVFYDDPVPLFHRHNIESQIEGINAREVPLPSGGSLVIDQTEAMVAIDVNSGKSRDARDAETNAYRTDLEAADEICRQLRLRDLGGVIVNDLIDMRDAKHRRAVESRFRTNLKKDRARTRTGSISQFGLLEMTRQRMRPSLKNSLTKECSACVGTGRVKSAESVVLDVMRRLAVVMQHKGASRIELQISPDVAFHLLNRKRGELADLERKSGRAVLVRVGGGTIDHVRIAAFDERGGQVGEFDGPLDVEAIAPRGKATYRELDDPALAERNAELAKLAEATESVADDTDDDVEEASGDQDTRDESDDEQTGGRKKRRRRRRGGRKRRKSGDRAEGGDDAAAEGSQSDGNRSSDAEDRADDGQREKRDAQATDAEGKPNGDGESDEPAPKSNGRRRRRRRRSSKGGDGESKASESGDRDAPTKDGESKGDQQKAQPSDNGEKTAAADGEAGGSGKKKRRRGGRRRSSAAKSDEKQGEEQSSKSGSEGSSEPEPVSRGYSNKVLTDANAGAND